jgi:hypothetical protein
MLVVGECAFLLEFILMDRSWADLGLKVKFALNTHCHAGKIRTIVWIFRYQQEIFRNKTVPYVLVKQLRCVQFSLFVERALTVGRILSHQRMRNVPARSDAKRAHAPQTTSPEPPSSRLSSPISSTLQLGPARAHSAFVSLMNFTWPFYP